MLDPKHLGPALRRLRLYRDLRQHQLADATGVTKLRVRRTSAGGAGLSLGQPGAAPRRLGADFAALQWALRDVRHSR